jgi:hypothetical protein
MLTGGDEEEATEQTVQVEVTKEAIDLANNEKEIIE